MASLVGETFFGLDLGQFKGQFGQLRRRMSKRVLLIEFGLSSVTLAEVQVLKDSISLAHVRRYPVPDDALERGVPTDPAQMADLIKAHCSEANIPAHRAAVVIPPDAMFSTLVNLPASVDPGDALAHALAPASGVQVPIQLDQTDAELLPLALPQTPAGERSYFLAAVPRRLVDRVVETLQLAEFELLRLQLGTIAQLVGLGAAVEQLAPDALLLHIELQRECSWVTSVSAAGPLKIARLTAIREFPEPDPESAAASAGASATTEPEIVASDRYLPLSELDLRRLTLELKQLMREGEAQFEGMRYTTLALAGPGSAHPLLAPLMREALGLPVELCRPLTQPGVGTVQLDQPMLMQRLGRLVGLGLSFLQQNEQLVRTQSEPELLPMELVDLAITPESSPADEWLDITTLTELDTEPQQPLEALPESEDRVEAAMELSSPTFSSLQEPLAQDDASDVLAPAAKALLEEPEPLLTMADPDDGAPFSMGDLMNSYVARQDEQPKAAAVESNALDASYLSDDPAQWPSVSKAAPDQSKESSIDETL